MFTYWNEKDREYKEYIKSKCNYIKSILTNGDIEEVGDFLKEHTFILQALGQAQRKTLSMRFGLEGQKQKSLQKIAEEASLSHERIRQILIKAKRTLMLPEYVQLLAVFKDGDIGYAANNFICLDEILDLKERKLCESETKSREKIKKQYKEYYTIFEGVLQLSTNYFREDCIGVNTINDVLTLDKDQQKSLQDSNIIKVVNRLGLSFQSENLTKESWVIECCEGLKARGSAQIASILNIKSIETLNRLLEFENLMLVNVRDLNLSRRAHNSLLRGNLLKVGDIVYSTERELKGIMGMGESCAEEIIKKMKELGLDLCPDKVDRNVWRDEMAKRFNIEFKSEVITLNKQKKYSLTSPIESLNLSTRASNCLLRNKVQTIQDLISLSELELMNLNFMGEVTYNEIKSELKELGLEIRPPRYQKTEWIELMRRKQNNLTIIPQSEEFDINEIPKKYRRIYAIGAFVEAQSATENKSSSERLIARAANNHKNIQKQLPKIKLHNKKTQQLSCEEWIEYLSSLLNEIKDEETKNEIVETINRYKQYGILQPIKTHTGKLLQDLIEEKAKQEDVEKEI